MTDDNSKIPAQDMTSTDTDNNELDTSPRVFDITADLNIAPVKDDIDNGPTISIPNNIFPNATQIQIIKNETPTDSRFSEKNLDLISNKINAESEPSSPIITTKPIDPTETSISQFGPANPPAKTIGMNRISFNNTVVQKEKEEVSPENLQEAVAAIKITTKPIATTITKIPDHPWETEANSKIKPLRTYETDFAEAMAKKRISSASIIIAENKKKDAEIIQNQPKDTVAPYKAPEPIQENYKRDEMNKIPKPVQEIFVKTDILKNAQPPKDITIPYNPVPIQKDFVKTDILKNAQPPKNEVISKNSHSTKNWLLAIFSLILICGGVYFAFYLYQKSPLSQITTNTNNLQLPQIEKIKSIVSADSKTFLNIDGKNQISIISAIKTEISKSQQEKTLKEIILTKSTNNTVSKVKAEEILKTMGVSTPDLFSRSLSDDWMLGVYSGIGEQKNLFIITTNNFFQNTFAGLIQWEKTMPDDLKQYLYSELDIQNSFTIRGQYKDKIIKNKDVREYISDNGHISFLYSFISNDKLVITNSEDVLEEIITRLEKDGFVR